MRVWYSLKSRPFAGRRERERIAELERQVNGLRERLSWQMVTVTGRDGSTIIATEPAQWSRGSTTIKFSRYSLTTDDLGRFVLGVGWPAQSMIVAVVSSQIATVSVAATRSSSAAPT